jgi:hypothetical protein
VYTDPLAAASSVHKGSATLAPPRMFVLVFANLSRSSNQPHPFGSHPPRKAM